MLLKSGERYRLTSASGYARITRGSCEAYAVTTQGSFRQAFLAEIAPGQAAFPALDEFGRIDIELYAIEDSELELAPLASSELEELRRSMRLWLYQLVQLPWLAVLADHGDDVLIPWRRGTVLAEASDTAALLEDFRENEEIFAMLLGARFQAEDKKLAKNLDRRDKNNRRLIDTAIGNLLGEDEITQTELSGDSGLDEVSFAVRRVARALSMDTERIELAPEIARKLSRLDLLRRLIQKGNMQLRRVLLEGDWYKKDSGVYCGEHVVDETTGRTELAVMVPGRPGTYRMVTQACPTGRIIDDELAATILPTAFACYAGFPARALKLMDLLKFMVRSCWRGDYQTILLVSFFAGLIPLVTPIITETIFQDIIPIQDRQGLATVVQVMMVTSFTTAALGIVRQVALLRITTHIDMGAEAALWGRMLALPTSFFRRFQSGELASRMSGLESVKSLVSGEMVRSIFDVVFSVWSLVLMCYYSIQLTGAAIAVWLVYVAISVFIYRRVIGFQREAVKAHNAQAGIVQQIFAGLSKFRVQGAEAQAYYLWSRAFGESWRWNLKLRWQENYNTIIAAVQPFVLTMLLYYITVYVLTTTNADGTVTQGIGYAQFIAFSAAYSSFNSMLNSLIPLVGQYFAIKPQLENLAPILTEAPESTDDRQDAPVLSGAIEVSHLAFSYPGAEREVLHDVNLKIKAGETIAIVGRSGSGKSTLVRLLLGFETPKQGAIYYDGQDLAETNLASIRSQMGVVLQNGQLMTSDIFTNIIGMSASLTMDDAWNAAEAAGVARDIAAMPMGMHTVISEESGNISGGQRQRILIARALVRKPAIVIFDEATSALDNRTQSIVMDSLARLQGTRIIVAHRLSTIRDVDRIIVVDGGGIAESGTYAELMERGGIFAQLARRQIA